MSRPDTHLFATIMNFHRTTSLLALSATIALASNASAQQLWKPYGTGCPGSNGFATIGHTGWPVAGTTFSVDLHNGPAQAPALLFGGLTCFNPGIDLGFLGMPGCPLLLTPDYQLGFTFCDGGGNGAVPVAVPSSAQFLGLGIYLQWLVADPVNAFGGIVSNGSCPVIGDRAPIQVIGASSNTVALGSTVTLFTSGIDGNGDNTCLRVMWPNGDTALLRITNVQAGPTGQTVTAQLASLPNDPVNLGVPGQLAAFHGSGGQQAVSGNPFLGAPGSAWAWAWEGEDILDHMQMTPVQLAIPAPSGNRVYARYHAGATDPSIPPSVAGNCIEVQLPAHPCAPSANDYPSATTLLTDIHWNLICAGTGQSIHYDFFMDQVTVLSAFGPTTPVATVAAFHAVQIAIQLQQRYPGKFTVSGTSTGKIIICPVDTTCTVVGTSGKTIIKC